MFQRGVALLAIALAAPAMLHAQFDFNVKGHQVQVHSFASQGYAKSDQNNFLTMYTQKGTAGFSDGGLNLSTHLTDHMRVGAQGYIRNIGHLGNWHPELDWAFGDYKFKQWLGVRGGKVKTPLGLYNDTQDMEFIHTWAILPQSVYPLDLRGDTIAHIGGDIYGNVPFKRAGSLDYTVYGGQRPSDMQGGITRGLAGSGIGLNSYGGTIEGGDVRWTTPLKGLMLGASDMALDVTEKGTRWSNNQPYTVYTHKDHTEAGYTEYSIGNLRIDLEARREIRDQVRFGVKGSPATKASPVSFDIRSAFASAAYRINNKIEVGTYQSRFYPNWPGIRGLQTNHIFDQTFTARFDVTNYWDVKVEEHLMNGTAGPNSYHGFYTVDNLTGLQPHNKLFVLRTGFHF